ncbi:MAG: hypothetical protein JNL83_25600 [Myxococcales bacterium]|nr:hypothetical protein [Myxococcales bacterium]
MATPKYLGTGQPPADAQSGLFGRIGALFGAPSTPAYGVAPIAPIAPIAPAAVSARAPSVSASTATTPANGTTATQAPACSTADLTGPSACSCSCHVEPPCPIDPLANRIAIIVPHGFPFPGA